MFSNWETGCSADNAHVYNTYILVIIVAEPRPSPVLPECN